MLVATGVVSVQVGAGLAARLFAEIPPAGVTGVRLWAAAVLLAALTWRGLAGAVTGVIRRRAWGDAGIALGFGLTLALMNYSIYQSMARIPLGIAVTLEFLGPLGVAVASSRRRLDLVWVTLAGAGVALLARTGQVAVSHGRASTVHEPAGTTVAGIAFALLAAATWAAYILLSRATGRRFPGTAGLGIAMTVAALAVTPVAIAAGHAALLRPSVLGMGIAVGLLSSIIPYSLELEALRRIPAHVFGIWMSLEPAVAALVGLILLGESLTLWQWAAIASVMAACAGASRAQPQQPQA